MTTTTYPKPDDPVEGFTRADGTTEGHDDDHGRVIGIWENVKHYGAVGNDENGDGHDDTSAIRAAIAAADANKTGVVYFPHGYYGIRETIVLDEYQNVRFVGAGHTLGFQGPLGPGVVIDSQQVTGPAFSYEGGTDDQNAIHHWENIYLMAGRTGFKYKNAVRVTFENSGTRNRVNDGHADNTGVLLINSFWFDFIGGTYDSPSSSDPSIILRGQTVDVNVNTTYLVTMERLRFTSGAVECQWNAGGAIPNATLIDCVLESSAGLPFVKYTESGVHATDYTSCHLVRCAHFDQAASAALIEVDAADLVLNRPILESCQQGVDNVGIKVTAGSVLMPRITGAPNTMYGSFVQDGSGNLLSQVRDRDHGTDFIDTATDNTITTLTDRSGPMFRFAKSGDAYARAGVSTEGAHYWGPGGATATGWDTQLERSAAGVLQLSTGSLKLNSGALIQKARTIGDAATVATDASTGNVFVMILSTNRTIGAPTNGTSGQVVTYRIKNGSGGAMTTTWNAIFHLAGAWVDPANNLYRLITFMYDGGGWYEVSRTAADMA